MANLSPSPNNQPQQNSTIDLYQIANQNNLELDLKIKTPKSLFDKITESLVLACIAAMLLYALVSSSQILNSPQSSPEDKKNAQSVVTLIVGGALGYVAGRTTANKN